MFYDLLHWMMLPLARTNLIFLFFPLANILKINKFNFYSLKRKFKGENSRTVAIFLQFQFQIKKEKNNKYHFIYASWVKLHFLAMKRTKNLIFHISFIFSLFFFYLFVFICVIYFTASCKYDINIIIHTINIKLFIKKIFIKSSNYLSMY